ncbi:hypothetical protein MMC22_010166 [Lobaria immixta]|nr:hypothetical protein [Lobaria immixta]
MLHRTASLTVYPALRSFMVFVDFRGRPGNMQALPSDPLPSPHKCQKLSFKLSLIYPGSRNPNSGPEPADSGASQDIVQSHSDSDVVLWPESLLSRNPPNAKILTYGYNADVVGGFLDDHGKNGITNHANGLMVKLSSEINNQVRPSSIKPSELTLDAQKAIISVVYGLGRIIIKDV